MRGPSNYGKHSLFRGEVRPLKRTAICCDCWEDQLILQPVIVLKSKNKTAASNGIRKAAVTHPQAVCSEQLCVSRLTTDLRSAQAFILHLRDSFSVPPHAILPPSISTHNFCLLFSRRETIWIMKYLVFSRPSHLYGIHYTWILNIQSVVYFPLSEWAFCIIVSGGLQE